MIHPLSEPVAVATESRRLVLRQFTLDDVDAVTAMYSDPIGMKFKGPPRSHQWAREMIADTIRYYTEHGYGRWAIISKAYQRFVGLCGFLHQHVDGANEIEISYHLDRSYWGRGFATEAAIAVRESGFGRLGFSRLVSLVNPLNIASQRVATKNGMQYEKEVFWKGHSVWVYAINCDSN